MSEIDVRAKVDEPVRSNRFADEYCSGASKVYLDSDGDLVFNADYIKTDNLEAVSVALKRAAELWGTS